MELFPHFIVRLGGMPYNDLAKLSKESLCEEVKGLDKLRQERQTLAETLSELLYQYIPTISDGKTQNQLVNARRKIFQGKELSTELIELIEATSDAEIKHKLDRWLDISTQERAKTKALHEAYNTTLLESRKTLAHLANDENLQKGLILSSQALLMNIDPYQKCPPGQLRKKELKTEESLLKYISRMAAKTSPFSTFTNLVHGTFNHSNSPEVLRASLNGEHKMRSFVCLNNMLYGYLRTLFTLLPEMYRLIPLRVNPTINKEEESWVFLTNHNNVEAFQRIPLNPVVELFYELIKEKDQNYSLTALLDEIEQNEYIDAEREELEAYVKQLTDYGFIEFHTGVSGLDPHWDKKLSEELTNWAVHCSFTPEIIQVLADLRLMASEYEDADVKQRLHLLSEAHKRFRALCMKLHEAAGLPEGERRSREEIEAENARKRAEAKLKQAENKDGTENTVEKPADEGDDKQEAFQHQSSTLFTFKPEQMFYEDTSVNINVELRKADCEKLLADVDDLLTRLKDFDALKQEHIKMFEFFEKQYPEQTQVALMQFYEDYYRLVKVPEAKAALKKKENPADAKVEAQETGSNQDPEQVKRDEQINALSRSLKDKIDLSASEINLNTTDIDAFFPKRQLEEMSFGAFLQTYVHQGKLRAMLNANFAGNGKMFSRFLHIFDPAFTAAIRQNNEKKDVLRLENCDASMFNANLHPPLMEKEVWMPGGQNALPRSEQVPITDLSIERTDTGQLRLVHISSARTTEVYDLGFQGQRGRSQLFQLLAKFSPVKAIQLWPLVSAVNRLNVQKDKEAVQFFPRISYNEHLILQRKRWYIPKVHLPEINPALSDSELFTLINQWRLKQGIDQQVFIFLTHSTEQNQLSPEQWQLLGRDGYKPQFIDFASPLLVQLFAKMLPKVPLALRVDEALPHPNDMLSTGEQAWVSEWVMQWSHLNEENTHNTTQNKAKAVY